MNVALETEVRETREISLDLIDVNGRLREVDEDAAEQLSFAIAKSDLINAITVRPTDAGRFELIAGGHRLRAHELLKLDVIRADIRDLSDEEAELVEIEENLFRNDLTCVERVLSLGLWERSFKEENPEMGNGGDRKSDAANIRVRGSHSDRFDEVMSRKTGRSRRSNFEDLAIFKALDIDALKALAASPIADNGQQLKVLAKLSPDERRACVADIVGGHSETPREWHNKVSGKLTKADRSDAQNAGIDLINAWSRANKKDRQAFLAFIGASLVSDKAGAVK